MRGVECGRGELSAGGFECEGGRSLSAEGRGEFSAEGRSVKGGRLVLKEGS